MIALFLQAQQVVTAITWPGVADKFIDAFPNLLLSFGIFLPTYYAVKANKKTEETKAVVEQSAIDVAKKDEETKAALAKANELAELTHTAVNKNYEKMQEQLTAAIARQEATQKTLDKVIAQLGTQTATVAKVVNGAHYAPELEPIPTLLPEQAPALVTAIDLKQDVAEVKDDTGAIRSEVVETVKEAVETVIDAATPKTKSRRKPL